MTGLFPTATFATASIGFEVFIYEPVSKIGGALASLSAGLHSTTATVSAGGGSEFAWLWDDDTAILWDDDTEILDDE